MGLTDFRLSLCPYISNSIKTPQTGTFIFHDSHNAIQPLSVIKTDTSGDWPNTKSIHDESSRTHQLRKN